MNQLARRNVSLDHIPGESFDTLGKSAISLLNISGVAMGRSTHYATKEEQLEAEMKFHQNTFAIDRGIYTALFTLPGITDYSKQMAVNVLLSNRFIEDRPSCLKLEDETKIIKYLTNSLPANRKLNMFGTLRKDHVNNSRTRKLILKTLLNHESFTFWSVKYRNKIKIALEHCWGKKNTGIIASILPKPAHEQTTKELDIIDKLVTKYIFSTVTDKPYKAIEFVLNDGKGSYSDPLHLAFKNAREDINEGKALPKEILEGLRSTYHKTVTQEEMLKLTKGAMTSKQKMQVQKKAEDLGVKVEFDPKTRSMVDLYKLIYENGTTIPVDNAIVVKARQAARALPFHYDSIGILLDDSQSMRGSREQRMRAMAVGSAMTEILTESADAAYIETTSGRTFQTDIRPLGETELALPFIKLLQNDPDAIFIISDGYENAPAGRFAEVKSIAKRKLEIDLPVYHFNPVASSDAVQGLRKLDENIMAIPVSNPETIGVGLMAPIIEQDPKLGLESIVRMALDTIDKELIE